MNETPKPDDTKTKTPDLKDVEPGSDADETPTPETGKTPPNLNETSGK